MKFNDMQMWVLGQAFMENFYTIYDGSDPQNLKIGMNVPIYETPSNFSEILAISVVSLIGLAVLVLLVVICHKRRQDARLEAARKKWDLNNFKDNTSDH